MKNLWLPLDRLLNSITMYRLVELTLLFISGVAIIFGFLDLLPFSGIALLVSALALVLTCRAMNTLFAKLLHAPTNKESSTITALILFLILAPPTSLSGILLLIAVGTIAMAGKYIVVWKNKHLLNPAAAALVLISLLGSGEAIWWIGSAVLLPFVTILGLLIVRKIRRFHLFLSFLATSIFTIFTNNWLRGTDLLELAPLVVTSWPIMFFGTIMLTEPLTTPPTKKWQLLYGALVGVLFGTPFHFGPLFSTPEFALVAGNVFSYLVSSKRNLHLFLTKRLQISPTLFDFIFTPKHPLPFVPGQYLEWTLPHPDSDARGNRRYFTIASSPTEPELRLGVKIDPQHSSTYKQALLALPTGGEIWAGQLSGDFTLPRDTSKKLAFIAGGIGITPFRSMIKYLIDTKEKRDIVLCYSASQQEELMYLDIFHDAEKKIGLKFLCSITQKPNVPKTWKGQVGRLSAELIRAEIPDYQQRMFYLSGPNAMVEGYTALLSQLGVPDSHIVTDYFPGY